MVVVRLVLLIRKIPAARVVVQRMCVDPHTISTVDCWWLAVVGEGTACGLRMEVQAVIRLV